MAGWFRGPTSPVFLFPCAPMLGGLAQFLAGMWAYEADDALATLARSRALVTVLTTLAASSTLAAIAMLMGLDVLARLAGWIFVPSAVCAWYTATAMLFLATFGREILPRGRTDAKTIPLGDATGVGTLHQPAATRRAS